MRILGKKSKMQRRNNIGCAKSGNRDFHSKEPDKVLLFDITEFSLSAGKVYLSLVVDCCDRYLSIWTIGLHLNADTRYWLELGFGRSAA